MFGIGLPEMLLILALALIVVGPDKLPELARSVAKGVMDLKSAADELKGQIDQEANPIKDITPDLEEAAQVFKKQLLEQPVKELNPFAPQDDLRENAAKALAELHQEHPSTVNENNDKESEPTTTEMNADDLTELVDLPKQKSPSTPPDGRL